jgi:excisionase family DNA binding protein
MLEDDKVQELLTPDEVCQVLKISPAKFYRLATSGRLPAVKIGSTWRVKPDELRHWIDRQASGAYYEEE